MQVQEKQHDAQAPVKAPAAAGLATQASGQQQQGLALPTQASLGRLGSAAIPIAEADIEALRHSLPPDLRGVPDEPTLKRFLRATGGKVQEVRAIGACARADGCSRWRESGAAHRAPGRERWKASRCAQVIIKACARAAGEQPAVSSHSGQVVD